MAMPGALSAQQKLNLGFEALSTEGMQRPWGWNVSAYASNVTSSCDATFKKSGEHSLRIESGPKPDTFLYELSFFVEPSQIFNRTVTVQGYSAGNLKEGEAGMRIETYGEKNGAYATLQRKTSSIAKLDATHWQPLSASLKLGDQCHSLMITLFFRGDGKVWFDDLELKLDGRVVPSVPVAPAFTQAQQKWINTQAQPFRTVEPHQGVNASGKEFNKLEHFKAVVGDARIIALGESTHGTSEFFKLKHRLLQYGVQELGVRVFILEDNQLRVERINRFVLHGQGTAETVIKGLFAVWNRAEMLSMIQWVRDYNLEHPDDPVEFVGMDVQDPTLALDSLDGFLKVKGPAVRQRVARQHEHFRKNWRNAFSMEDSVKESWSRKARRVYKLVKGLETKWLATAKSRRDSMRVYWATQNARLVQQCIESIRTGGFEGRDKAMAENVDWVLEHRPAGTRAMVWAHDFHVNRGEAAVAKHNYFEGKSMGSHLAKKYGEDYRAFGLFTYQGQARGTVSYSDFSSVECGIYTSPEGTLDQALHLATKSNRSKNLILDLREAQKSESDFQWLFIPRPVRYMGYVCEDYGFGSRHAIPHQFDAILFIDETTGSQLIK